MAAEHGTGLIPFRVRQTAETPAPPPAGLFPPGSTKGVERGSGELLTHGARARMSDLLTRIRERRHNVWESTMRLTQHAREPRPHPSRAVGLPGRAR